MRFSSIFLGTTSFLLIQSIILGFVSFIAYGQGQLPTLKEPIIVHKWRVIGPFPMGAREAGTEPLAYFSSKPFKSELLQGSFPSYISPGAEVRWDYAFSDENGNVSISFPGIPEKNWELIKDEWGFAGTIYLGYAYGAFEIEGNEPVYALIDLQGAGSFKLGEDSLLLEGLPWPGDSYGHNLWKQPIKLSPGRHLVRVGFTYRGSFTFRILPVGSPVLVIEDDITFPDIVRGKSEEALVGIPFANCTDEWVEIEKIRAVLADVFSSAKLLEKVRIAPLSIVKAPVLFQPGKKDTSSIESEVYELPIEVHYSGGSVKAKVRFRVRDSSQSRRETYLSNIDHSVQYYAILPPLNYDVSRKYGLILSLHGAGVEAEGQVDSYTPKDWAFVVAATNRRRFGFDWQDWGRLDTLQVLEEVKNRYLVDEWRIHLTGHSMGGHGTWYLGLTYPDKWASIAPSAGWTTFSLYVPTFLRRNLTMGSPRANLLWELAMREDNTLVLTENALNLPVFALEGGADDNVPPQQPRMLVELLRRRGYNVTYEEVPGMGHWWDASPDRAGTDCVDWPAFNKFWQEHSKIPYPRKVLFRTHNYAISNSAYWVEVIAPNRAYEDIRVDAEVTSRRALRIVTLNVKILSLHLPEELIGGAKTIPEAEVQGGASILVNLNGQPVRIKPKSDDKYYLLCDEFGKWNEVSPEIALASLPKKKPECYGPWKQALMRPFIIVYGTSGGDEETLWNLQLARFYAQQWWYRANGYTLILPDKELSEDYMAAYNLVLIGSAKTNSVTARLENNLPIRLKEEGVLLGTRFIFGHDLTVKFVYPNPDFPKRLLLVEEAQSPTAFRRLFSFMEIYSGSGFPDWAVFGDEVELLGLAGFTAMGFFNLDWQFDDMLSFYNNEVISKLSSGQ